MPVNRLHENTEHRYRDNDQIRAVGELGDRDDHQHDAGERLREIH